MWTKSAYAASQVAVSKAQDVDFIYQVHVGTLDMQCKPSVTSNLHPTSYISHQKLYEHTGQLHTQKNDPHNLWLTQSGLPKGQSGREKWWLWWCHRKGEQGQLEKGQLDDMTHTHTHPSPSQRNTRPFPHSQWPGTFRMFSTCLHFQGLNKIRGNTERVQLISAECYWLVAALKQSCWQCRVFSDFWGAFWM